MKTSRRHGTPAVVAVMGILLALATGCATSVGGPATPLTSTASATSLQRSSPQAGGSTAPARYGVAAPSRGGMPSATTGGSPVPATTAPLQVHSPGAVDVDERLAPGQCHATVINAAAGGYLPDPSCTRGAVDPAITEANIGQTICVSGYTATVRPPAAATDRFKATALAAYGEVAAHTIELDHLVSLEIGGANSASNLWPELNRAGATGTTNPKDAVEDTLHKAVCDHEVSLIAAQDAIANDWITALHTLGI